MPDLFAISSPGVFEVELVVITSNVERKRKIEMDHLRRNTCKASI